MFEAGQDLVYMPTWTGYSGAFDMNWPTGPLEFVVEEFLVHTGRSDTTWLYL
jgi:hypothetical protein